MPRKSTVLCAIAVSIASGVLYTMPSAHSASFAGIAADPSHTVDMNAIDPMDPQSFLTVEPDVVTSSNGRRIEVYSSVGDNEGSIDWRSVNLFAYLVNSVPVGKHSYTTVFNSLHDGMAIQHNAATDQWSAKGNRVFSPTAAYLELANKYPNQSERLKYIHVLGAKKSMTTAYANNSSLARLVRAGYKTSGAKAVDYNECSKGNGGCLSASTANLMHSKFGAFESAADSTGTIRDHVVYLTSSNMNGASGGRKSNVSIVMYDDEKAYNAIKNDVFGSSIKAAKGASPASALSAGYLQALGVDPATGVIRGMPTDSGVTLFPSPRARSKISGNSTLTNRTDVEANFLLRQAALAGSRQNCKIYSIHSLFNSSRNGVKTGLSSLAKKNCDVRIVLGTNAISSIVDGYFTMSTDLRELINRVEFGNVHDKTLSYADATKSATFGGSSNFTGTSLDYDELAFRSDSADVAQAVQRHSERIYQAAKGNTTITVPRSVAMSPASSAANPLRLRVGDRLQLSTRVSPQNALITNTTWASSSPTVTVSATGVVRGVVANDDPVIITATATSPNGVEKVARAYIKVSNQGTSSAGSGPHVTAPPVLTMARYQAPANQKKASGRTNIVVTWGSGAEDYSGVVKLQYYSKGWKTYKTWVNVKNGVGRISPSFKSSKTWRAYGARIDKIHRNGAQQSYVRAPTTAKTKSQGYSINVVRSKSASVTPRLYGSTLAKTGTKVPFLLSWKKPNGKFQLQMRTAKGKWKTHSSYKIPAGSTQLLFSVPVINTKYWRIVTKTGKSKGSNTIRVLMR